MTLEEGSAARTRSSHARQWRSSHMLRRRRAVRSRGVRFRSLVQCALLRAIRAVGVRAREEDTRESSCLRGLR